MFYLLLFSLFSWGENWQTVEAVQNSLVTGFSNQKSCLEFTKTACVQIDGVDLEVMDLVLRGRDWVFVENADKLAAKEKRLAEEKAKEDARLAKEKAMQDAATRIKASVPNIDSMTTAELKALIRDLAIERGL